MGGSAVARFAGSMPFFDAFLGIAPSLYCFARVACSQKLHGVFLAFVAVTLRFVKAIFNIIRVYTVSVP